MQQAIGDAISHLRILTTADDVLAIEQDVIHTVDLTGSVKVGGSWSLPISVNQLSLADAKLPFNAEVSVTPAMAVSVEGDVALTSEFAVRFRRSSTNLLRLGLYKKKGQTFEASFTAAAGIQAGSGQTAGIQAGAGQRDLINKILKAIAPGVDFSSMQPGDAATFQQVVKDSLDRSLAISLNAACSAAFFDEAAIVYEIDTAAGDAAVHQATKDAIARALLGDWTAVSLLPNAHKIRNVVTDTVDKSYSFTINLLGLYNRRSVDDFVRSMRIIRNLEDGSVVVTDSITATEIVTASAPLAADPDRLRAALDEAFVATVTYKALHTGIGLNADFHARQDFLLYEDSMSYREALKQLNAGEVLGVMPIAVKTGLTSQGPSVRHARFSATCTYDNQRVLQLFFSNVATMEPRTKTDLTKIGRQVLARLLDPPDPTDNQRIAVLNSDSSWAKMDDNPAQILSPFRSDWVVITWWASAVATLGPQLADTIRFAKIVQGDPTANADFMKKRAALALALDGVTHKMKPAFDKAFPICVMASLAGPATAPDCVFEASWNGTTMFSNKPSQIATAKAFSQPPVVS